MGATKRLVYAVTGASRGLGLEFVKQLLEKGNQVIAAARNPKGASQLQSLSAKFPSTLTLISLDVSDAASIKDAAEEVANSFAGGIDVLINNAGILGTIQPAIEQNDQEFKDVLLTNVLGPFLVTKAFLPLIKKGSKKQIVQISSTMGSISSAAKHLQAESPIPMARYQLAYRASKAALNMETVSLALDLKQEGITIVSICPGWVKTDMGSSPVSVIGGTGPELEPPASIGGMLSLMDGLTIEQTGSFFNYEGKIVPF